MLLFGISWDFLGFLGISWDFLTLLGQSPDFLTLSAAAIEPLVDGKHRHRCAEVSAAHVEVSMPHSGCGSWLATTGVGCARTAVRKKGRPLRCLCSQPRGAEGPARGRPGGGPSLAGAGSGWGLAAPLLPCVPGGSFSDQYP